MSIQRKRAVIACFRQTSLHSLPKHAAINLFLRTYTDLWLNDENAGQEVIIDHLTMTFEEAEMKKSEAEEEAPAADQLTQLIHMFSQSAIMERAGELPDDDLYMAYADIMAKSCGGGEEEGGEEEEEGEGPSLQEQDNQLLLRVRRARHLLRRKKERRRVEANLMLPVSLLLH